MKRKSFLVVLFVLLMSQWDGLPAFAAHENGFDYDVNSDGNTVTITGYLGPDKDVVIPNELGGNVAK